jgi:hypothetical protein
MGFNQQPGGQVDRLVEVRGLAVDQRGRAVCFLGVAQQPGLAQGASSLDAGDAARLNSHRQVITHTAAKGADYIIDNCLCWGYCFS